MYGNFRGKQVRRATFAFLLLVATAAAQAPVPLGTSDSYAVLAGSAVTNTGASVVTGDVGVSPGTAVTGFPPGTVVGTTRTAAAAAPAEAGLTNAYGDAAGRTPVITVATELGGQTLVAGVYNSASGTFGMSGILTLDGQNNPNAVFIFQTATTLITAAGAPGNPSSQVVLSRGAQACNIFWQIGSSATLGTFSVFQGNILALSSITATTGATINGRLLARNGAVTLDTNSITSSSCSSGSIQVVKNTVGGDGTFPFTSNFGLTSLTTTGGTASQTFNGLTPGGNYSLSETVPSGWTQTGAGCTNGTPAAVIVVVGSTTVCTFTNARQMSTPLGSIKVIKNTVGGNGTFGFVSNFGLTSLTTSSGTASPAFRGLSPKGFATITGTATMTFAGLTPGGSYSLSETVPAGWIQTAASCTNGTPASIIVVNGTTTTCTITNTQTTPVIANITPSSATATGSDFTLCAEGSNFIAGATMRWNGWGLATTFVSVAQVCGFIPASLIAVPGNISIMVTNPGGLSSNAVVLPISLPVPAIALGGIVPIYSSVSVIQSGSWASIFGTSLAMSTSTWSGNFPTSLEGVSVTIHNKPAYLFSVSPSQINLQAPDDTATGPVDVVVTTPLGTATSTVILSQYSPAFSLFPDNTHAAGVILVQNGSGAYGNGTYDLAGPAGYFSFSTRPAKAGDILELFGVGFGATTPPVPAGQIFGGAAPTIAPVTVSIGGVAANVLFSGITEAGTYQITVVVPSTGSGDQLLQATVGGVLTQNKVYVTVQ